MTMIGKTITRLDSDVWAVLDRHQSMPKGDGAYVGAPKIAEEIGSDMRNVQRSIHRLEKIGLLKQRGFDKRYGTRRWKVLLPTVLDRTVTDRTVSDPTVSDPDATVLDPSTLRSQTTQVADIVAEEKQIKSQNGKLTKEQQDVLSFL